MLERLFFDVSSNINFDVRISAFSKYRSNINFDVWCIKKKGMMPKLHAFGGIPCSKNILNS